MTMGDDCVLRKHTVKGNLHKRRNPSSHQEGSHSMKNIKHTLRRTIAVAIIAGVGLVSPTVTHAAPPAGTTIIGSYATGTENGAYVRILGDPGDGTLRFQYGWSKGTDASSLAKGYTFGLYDITNSTYILKEYFPKAGEDIYVNQLSQLFKNGPTLPKLPNGDYKVNFFVRKTYTPSVTNVAAIEVPFTVNYMGG